MKDWYQHLKNQGVSFSAEDILIIPTSQMRTSFERMLLKEVPQYTQVRFMTFYEWIVQLTASYRFQKKMKIISRNESVHFIINELQKVDEKLLQEYQKRVSTAEEILNDLLLIRLNNLDEKVINANMQPVFKEILVNYEQFLLNENAVDYANMLKFVIEQPRTSKQNIVMYPNDNLSIVEKEIIKKHAIPSVKRLNAEKSDKKVVARKSYGQENGIKHALSNIQENKWKADESYFVYTDEAILHSIYLNVISQNTPATFAEGIPIEITKTYSFIENLAEYIENGTSLIQFKKMVDAGQVSIKGERVSAYVFNRTLSIPGMSYGKRFLSLVGNALEKEEDHFWLSHSHEIQDLLAEMQWIEKKILRLQQSNTKDSIHLFMQIAKRIFHVRSEKEAVEFKWIIKELEEFSQNLEVASYSLRLQDILRFIQGKKIHQSNEQPGHLHVSSIGNVGLIYRKHYAWFGMATDELTKKHIQSAFIPEKLLEKYNLPNAVAKNKMIENKLERILENPRASHELYFNFFNTTEIREKNPTFIWRKYKEQDQDVIGYVRNDLQKTKPTGIALRIEEENWQGILYNEAEHARSSVNLSPSSTKMLMDCSRQFMYTRILKNYENEIEAPDHTTWLSKPLLGNLYHELLEQFYEKKIQNSQVEDLINEVFHKYEQLYPALLPSLIDTEKERARGIITEFAKHEEGGWIYQAAEIPFSEEGILEVLIQESPNISVNMRGFIDRVDYHPEKNEYRIVDYKTGRLSSNNKVLQQGDLQIALYEKAFETQHKNSNEIHFNGESYYDYIFAGERKYYENKTILNNLVEKMEEFPAQWDDVTFDSNKFPCRYCGFKTLCEMRKGELK